MPISPETLTQIATDYAAAWSAGDPQAVASFYAETGSIAINRGDLIEGRAAVAEMAAGFYAAFPDLVVRCDGVRYAGDHAIFLWTLEGHHAETGNPVVAAGWEEWDLDENGKVRRSLGWFDAVDYDRQIQGA
ncbi:MAG: nuclear transport factor 2 family protein [Pseudomonadota bacterium]